MTQLSKRFVAISLGGLTMLGACQGRTQSAVGDTTVGVMHQPGSLESVRSDSAAGEVGMSDASSTQAAVEGNMRAMMGASGAQIQAMVPEHRQLVTSMIGQMTHEMGSVHTAGSAAWMATRDSVNGDLMRFPMMSAADLQAIMPGHDARLRRLMQMRTGMMGGRGRMMPNQ